MHQSKRPYNGSQPSITSYFPTTASSPQYSIQSSNEHRASTPQLPPTVQSSLINVGMRVRKSVPEGYKTGSYSAFNLFSESAATPQPSIASSKPRTRPRAGARELTPFCGIMKVGGLDNQQWGIYNPGTTLGDDAYQTSSSEEEDNVPDLSQGSMASNFSMASSPSASNKRRFFDEEENGTEEFTGMGASVLGEGRRVLAVPRKKKSAGAGKGLGVARLGQENRVQVFGQDGDFEDASFLDYESLRANRGIGEVEMSG